MQSLNFEALNIGDIVLTVPKTKRRNIGDLGMSTSLYVVQSVDTENLTAVLADTSNGTANLLTTSADGQTTVAPMSGNAHATTCEAFQMSHVEANEKRMSERIQAERLLGRHLLNPPRHPNSSPCRPVHRKVLCKSLRYRQGHQ